MFLSFNPQVDHVGKKWWTQIYKLINNCDIHNHNIFLFLYHTVSYKWKSSELRTWMKKSFGFPTKLLHMSPLNNEVMVLMGMAPSVP